MPTFDPTPALLTRRTLLACAALPLLATSARGAERIAVVASFSILGDLVRVVGGDRVAVITLVGPDEDAHVFEPRPGDARTLLTSKLLVVNGLGFEPWASKLARAAGYKGETVVATHGVRPLPSDPHAWQNPNHVVLYVRNIAAGLSRVDADSAPAYQARAEAYIQELLALDAWIKEQFSSLPVPKRKVITSHDAFGYFAAQYQVQFLAAQGINTETEPSAKQIAQLIRQIRQEKIHAVFLENMGSPKLMEQLSRDAGAVVGGTLYADALSAPDQPGATYLQLMRYNVRQLAAGMQKN